jgi:RNA polymerase sigma factor (sigma-70 family)
MEYRSDRIATVRPAGLGYSDGTTNPRSQFLTVSEPDSDEELMLRYSRGDAGAFDELYNRHRAPLFRFILRQVSEQATAEELYQDVWMGLIRAHQRYQATAKFTTYLYQVARNRIVDHYRRVSSRPVTAMTFEDGEHAASEQDQPEAHAQQFQQAAQLKALLQELPREQQEAFLLRHEAGMSLDEIATITGTNSETVKSRLRYAMNKLRSAVGEEL